MYQLVPTINAMSRRLAKFEDSWITGYFGVGRKINRLINLSAFLAHADPAEQQAYDGRLRNIVRLLKAAGVEFGYLYEKDLYSGALVYDEGLDEAVVSQAGLVYQTLKSRHVKRLITVDPHTTNMLRTVYPRIIPGFDIEVKSYLEVLAERKMEAVRPLGQEVTVHDSCIYARDEDMIEPPRRLLEQGGVRLQEAELSGRLTQCCGGPLESLFPGKASEIASKRIGQLADCANEIVTLCPICLANLKRAAPAEIAVRDISDYLVQAYCPGGV
jgi:Fe-S oxidoreductase